MQQQEAVRFIGREAEMKAFTDWLDDADAPWILYIHDAVEEIEKKGGVGKTWLLRRYTNWVREKRSDIGIVQADFFNVGDRDRIFLAEKFVAGLQELYPAWHPEAFYATIKRHQEELKQAAPGSESVVTRVREDGSAALADDLQRLDEYLKQEQKTLLLFFDTYEAIEQNPGVAVLRLSQTFPDNYQLERLRVVIAGRNRLDWSHPNWQGREQDVRVVALPPFNPHEMLEYVRSESNPGLPLQSRHELALYDRTEGRPIMIGLAVDVLNHHILSLDELVAVTRPEFEGYLVTQINRLEHPLNWVILFMAHVYHRFNFSLLEWILRNVNQGNAVGEITREDLQSELPKLSFVRQTGLEDNFVLHDEMRRLVTKYCWEVQDPGKPFRKEISECVIEYYKQEIDRTVDEQRRQRYIIETLYHRLFIDLDNGLKYFQQYFQDATRLYRSAFARLLLQEAQPFTHLMMPAQRTELRFAEVKLHRIEENYAVALALLQELEHSTDGWIAKHQRDFLMEAGLNNLNLSRLPDADRCFKKCLEIEQAEGTTLRTAHLYSNLGAVSRRRGQFEQALQYYNESIALYRKANRPLDYANAIASTSTVYRLQGKIEEALRKARIAWRIRLDQFHEGKGNERLVGLSLNILGVIYISDGNILEAERCFDEAYDIFLRVNSKAGIAQVYNRFGQICLLKGELEPAREWFEKAQEASRNVNSEQLINSFNKLGNVCLLQHKWEMAAKFFQRAIAQADLIFDYYQQAESLIDLADACQHLEQQVRARQALQEAQEISSRDNYYKLSGRIEQMRAEAAYGAQEYASAFEHFAHYCHYMAQYNAAEFNIAIRKVTDALLGIPKEHALAVVKELLDYWTAQQLDESFPALPQALEEVDELMLQ